MIGALPQLQLDAMLIGAVGIGNNVQGRMTTMFVSIGQVIVCVLVGVGRIAINQETAAPRCEAVRWKLINGPWFAGKNKYR